MAAISIKTSTKVTPQCYAYVLPGYKPHKGWTKIGFTERDVKTRVREQTHTAGLEPKICWCMQASYLTEPYGTFTDKEFHAYLKKLGTSRKNGTEWFFINPEKARKDFIEYAQNHGTISGMPGDTVIPYVLRDEQQTAVKTAQNYFLSHSQGEFLWNAKPRFGKTLSAYDLCKQLNATNILIVTNRPAIANSWYSDYETFLGLESGYIFVSNVDSIKDKKYVYSRQEYLDKLTGDDGDSIKGCIEFVSLQDLKGSSYFGGPYEKLSELSKEKGITWDIMIVDEAHEGVDTYKTEVAFDQIKRNSTLHMSGTPFKALAGEKFAQEAIFNWTYADEQKKKRDWDYSNEQENPYGDLPQLCLYTYQMSEIVRDEVEQGITLADNDVAEYAFDLNEFFKTNESGKFIHDKEVDKFLDALTHQYNFPFSTPELRNELKHTFWLLDRVDSAKALARKLKIHPVFKDYDIVLAAGDGKIDDNDENETSYDKVMKAIHKAGTEGKTITLSVGQLTTGVTVKPWTAVLMLSNISSPSLYMQAAFRAQNPYLFHDSQGNSYRKENAYVFDFDPARTLTIYENFANDLIPDTAGAKGTMDSRKQHVRELLNFFPVYNDENGSMVKLDAEKVLTIPRHIHAKEVVDRGFMSNFLFANISNIFNAPKEVINIIKSMEAIKEPKKIATIDIDDDTAEKLYLDDNNEVNIPHEKIIGKEKEIFGEKIYGDIQDNLDNAIQGIINKRSPSPQKNELDELQRKFAQPVSDALLNTAKKKYGSDLKKSTWNRLEGKIQGTVKHVVNEEYGRYTVNDRQLENEKNKEIEKAQKSGASMPEITQINEKYDKKQQDGYNTMVNKIHQRLSEESVQKSAVDIVEVVEKEKLDNQKNKIEDRVRDHLRGFARTIPAFLMAFGDENTTLANFDRLVPPEIFLEVTENPTTQKGIELEQFCFLRDGGDYVTDDGETRHFDGHLFDEVVFNDSVKEFMNRKKTLANYFDENQKKDIFDYIPPQRSNQIFTPRKIVKEMVDMLEKENPGCFDNPNATFADLYMKSGLYITEIVKRLYRSSKMKKLFPEDKARIKHILENQVYGMAPSRIIYLIATNYIMGFDEDFKKNNPHFVEEDAAKAAKEGSLKERVDYHFGK